MRAPRYVVVLAAMALVLSCITTSMARASPRFELGLKAGGGLARLTGDDTAVATGSDSGGGGFVTTTSNLKGSRAAFLVGGHGTAYFSDRFGIRVETLYTQRGGKGDATVSSSSTGTLTGKASIRLDYIEVPLLAVVASPVGQTTALEVYAGPSFAWNTRAEAEIEVTDLDVDTEDISEFVKDTDVAGVIGAGLVFRSQNTRYVLDGRWTFGLESAGDSTPGVDIKTSTFSLTAGVAWPLGGKR